MTTTKNLSVERGLTLQAGTSLVSHLDVPKNGGLGGGCHSLHDTQGDLGAHDGAQAEGLEPDILLSLDVNCLRGSTRLVLLKVSDGHRDSKLRRTTERQQQYPYR